MVRNKEMWKSAQEKSVCNILLSPERILKPQNIHLDTNLCPLLKHTVTSKEHLL